MLVDEAEVDGFASSGSGSGDASVVLEIESW
jgi:hypothetical protein